MRLNRDIIAIVILLAIFLSGGLLLGGREPARSRQVGKEIVPDPSTDNDRASGSKALFEWTARLGYRPQTWRQPWSRLDGSRAPILLVIDPRLKGASHALTGPTFGPDAGGDEDSRLGPEDARALRAWLGRGRTAVVAASSLPTGHTAGTAHGEETDTFADAVHLRVETASPITGVDEFGPLQPMRDTQGVLSIHSEADARVARAMPDGLALFGDAAGPVAVSVPVGQGRLIVIADSRFASNANLPRAENAVFLANILARAARAGDVVLFDEYHHGESDLLGGATLWSLLGRPLQLCLLQLGLAGIVALGVLAVRFGRPVPLGQGMRRTSGEYVQSLAGLYARAGAASSALEILYRQFLRDVCARLALAPDVALEQLAAVAARRARLDQSRLRTLLATCEQRLDEGKVSEAELLDLTRRMDAIRKELGLA